MQFDLSTFLVLIGFGPMGWGGQLLRGAATTIEISVASYLFGMTLGLVGCWAKLSGGLLATKVAELYTTLVRAIPALLLIILLYYTGTAMFDAGMGLIGLRARITLSGFATVVFALGFIKGAYMTEVFRGAMVSIPKGIHEAGKALALPPLTRFRLVTFPLMLRIALPGLGNLWQSALKDSALVSVVGFEELLNVGKIAASQTKFYLSFFLLVAAIFLAISLISNLFIDRLERRLNRGFV
jgi:polar amino acid transport system permease protein